MTEPMTALSPSPFLAQGSGGDWGLSWIHYLFHITPSTSTPEIDTGRFASIAEGIRHALNIYSTSMLVLAGILLFYHLASMIAETAQTGVPFGKRTNQVWAPVRLIVAILLLVPAGSGLSAGQYLVIKIAEQGSSLASKAWKTIAESVDENFLTLIAPHPPNFSHLATAATEMELCHLIYQKFYEPGQNESPLNLIGPMSDALKLPMSHFADESWRYTNTINASSPLCGEYHFSDARRYDPFSGTPGTASTIERMTNETASFAHTQARNLVTQAQSIAQRAMPTFSGNAATFNTDIQSDLAALITSLRNDFDARWHSLTGFNLRMASQTLAQSTEAGWIAAATFVPDIVRLQENYGEIAAHLEPTVQEPTLAHPSVAQQSLKDAINLSLPYPTLAMTDMGKLQSFYNQVSRVVTQAHEWISTNQLSATAVVPISTFDITDHLNAGTEPEAAAALFARALDAKAIEQGLWGVETNIPDAGYPFSAPTSDRHNPLITLAEFGRRQYEVGNYLLGLAGSHLSTTEATAPAALTGLVGLGFLGGGLGLIFLIPFLPFARFLLAVLTWLLHLFEAVVAMPVVALAHLTPHGEGLSGGTARQAYVLWIALMIRPLLTLFGLVIGLLLFDMGLTFLGVAMVPFTRLSATTNDGLLIVANVGTIILYDILVYALANAAFKGIYLLPDQAMRWISSFVVTDGGDATSPAASPSGGGTTPSSLFSALANALHYQNGSSSSSSSSSTKAGGNAATTHATTGNNLKSALFPAYHEKLGEPATGTNLVTTDKSSTTVSSSGSGSSGDKNTPTAATKGTKQTPSPFRNAPFFPDKK